MLTKDDIATFFSGAYAKAALREGIDMRNIADLFEHIREQINIDEPYDWWDYIIMERKFNNDASIESLLELRESYYNFFFEKLITNLKNVYRDNNDEGLNLWNNLYATATAHLREDLLCMLCYVREGWGKTSSLEKKYSKLPKLMQEGRWPDAYPVYREIAANKKLSNKIRTYAEITLLQIVLYHYPEPSGALQHIENASSLFPDHFIVKRGWAEYYMKTGETQKARDLLLQVISVKPGDYFSFNCIGDCFSAESMLENAESWYQDALQKNFIQTESYQRLINLYADKKWFGKKQSEFENLLMEIEKRQRFRNSKELVQKNIATEECFKDSSLYQSYRDVGSAWYANDDFKKAEEWYKKAAKLQPGFSTVIIDLAYLKIHQENYRKAKEYFLQAMAQDKTNYDVHRGLAYLYEKQNKKEEAIKAYEESFKSRPTWSDSINNFIGNLYYSSKDYGAAETYFRKAVEANKNYDIYKLNLADALQAQADQLAADGKYNEAEKLYISAANTGNEPNRWNTLGNFYYKTERWQDAIDKYNFAISQKDTEPVYYENRGLALEKLNESARAEESYKEALKYDNKTGRYFNRLGIFYYNQKDYEQSLQYYLEAIKCNPDEPVYLENITLTYEQMNLPEKAEPYYLKILEIEPKNDKIMNLLGILYYKLKDYEKALQYYDKAINQNGKNSVYYENKGILFRAMEKYPEAIEAFEKALEINSKNDINWSDVGVLYYNQGDYDKAIEYYNKAIQLQPKVSLYHENIGLAYEKKNLFDDAIKNYEKALGINVENDKILNAIGVIYYNRKQSEQAIEYYRKAIALKNDSWVYQTNLGLALRVTGRNDEAIEVYKKAVKLKEDDYLNWNELGVLLSEKGNQEEAIEYYRKSINLQPNDPVVYMNLALALNTIGKPEEAIKVTEGHPLTPEVRKEVEGMMQKYLPSLFALKN